MGIRTKEIITVFICSFFVIACDKESDSQPTPSPYPAEIQFSSSGSGEHGFFDPSITEDLESGRLWMSYSAVDSSALWYPQNDHTVSTRIAYSDNAGETWTDAGEVNSTLDVTIPLAAPNNAGTWQNEVSKLIYDQGAIPSERWKLIWHHYLIIDGDRRFEHGWVAIKSASTPLGLAAATEVKLFGALGYDTGNDIQGGVTSSPIGGAPKIMLNTAYAAELNSCAAFSEPGMYATASDLYLSIQCAESATSNKIILLKCSSPCDVSNQASWQYLGIQLSNTEAINLGYLKLSAPDLFSYNGSVFLMASPVSNTPFNDSYKGCVVFKYSNLDTGTLVANAGQPTLQKTVGGDISSFNGACAFHEKAIFSGFIYSQAYPDDGKFFRFFMTGETL